jgi:hypothetical protein
MDKEYIVVIRILISLNRRVPGENRSLTGRVCSKQRPRDRVKWGLSQMAKKPQAQVRLKKTLVKGIKKDLA